jgi:branched-subunit amino acid aminotransferase/4-amino-4-deoxychorismate lyase
MKETEIASLFWCNGTILSKEKSPFVFDTNFMFNSNFWEYYYTSVTEILFFEQTYTRIKKLLKTCKISSELFEDTDGELFKNETKRLLIRNRYYKTARCYILFSFSPIAQRLNEFIFLVPDQQLFDNEKIIKKIFVSNSLKLSGTVMKFPTIENEFRKIIRNEMEIENADDCIILNQEQHIVESYRGNLFLLDQNMVYTPSPNSGCTPLLMREIVLKLFEQMGFQITEKEDLSIENLFDVQEVIIVGETGIYSLRGIEYKRYFDTTRKKLIAKIVESELS